MQKWMWLLLAMGLDVPAVQAQFGQPYDPRLAEPYGSSVLGGRDPFAPQVPGFLAVPRGNDPLGRTPFTPLPLGRQPWMPPTAQDFIHEAITGRSVNPGPRASGREIDPSSLPPSTFVGMNAVPPPSVSNIPKIDLKNLRFSETPLQVKEIGSKHPAKAGDSLSAWLRWEHAVGVFLLGLIGGLLAALTRSRPSNV